MKVYRHYITHLRWSYKVLRSLIFSAVIVVAVVFVLLYTALSVPPVQNYIREKVTEELEIFLGNDIKIGSLTIVPVNEVILNEIEIKDLSGQPCLTVGKLGAGINLWRLLFSGKIEVTYVELLDFTADIYQTAEGAPLNIDFIIKAFAPKDKTKPPTAFDLMIRNIVIRGGKMNFNRLWKSESDKGKFDISHVSITGLSGDITIPQLSNKHTEIDLRRFSFNEKSGLQVKEIGGIFNLSQNFLSVRNFVVRLPETEIHTEDFRIPLRLFDKTGGSNEFIDFIIKDSRITPSNLAAFYPPLGGFDTPIPLNGSFRITHDKLNIDNFHLGSGADVSIDLNADIRNYLNPQNIDIGLQNLNINIPAGVAGNYLENLVDVSHLPGIKKILEGLGAIEINLKGEYLGETKNISLSSNIVSSSGEIKLESGGIYSGNALQSKIKIEIPHFETDAILSSFPVREVTNATVVAETNANFKNLKETTGTVDFNVKELKIQNRIITNIEGYGTKEGNDISVGLDIDDINLNGSLLASAHLAGEDTEWNVEAQVNDFDTYSSFLAENSSSGYELEGNITVKAVGNHIDNLIGTLDLSDFSITKWDGKKISSDRLFVEVSEMEDNRKSISLQSEFADFDLEGKYKLSGLPSMIKNSLWGVFPALFKPTDSPSDCGWGRFILTIKNAQPIISFLSIPVAPLTEMEVSGRFDSNGNIIEVSSEIPFIQQGENKLITDTYLDVLLQGEKGELSVNAGTVYPTKKGLLKIDLEAGGLGGKYDVATYFNRGRNVSFYGDLALNIELEKDPLTGALNILADFKPTDLYLNDAEWNIEESKIVFTNEMLDVDNFQIRHDSQFVIIDGFNNKNGEGEIKVLLSEINMDYIFDTLNINHVTFGGEASGAVSAREIFSQNPIVHTDNLKAKNFAYNGALLGDADLRASLDLPKKMINLGAVINENFHTVAEAEGGVWFGRDSLSFKFKADGVNVGFMQPFMSAFSSDVKGRASGEALLYGTFSDIDMTGRIIADNVEIMIDYINARYTGSDTVIMSPGRIDIPHIQLHDKYGHTAEVTGELTHRCFHDPVFNFRVMNMDNLLVYDTNSKINSLWYGTIFASGSGEITGRPGLVRIAADVETEKGSDFTFVLSDQQEAIKSNFLTFTDRRKEEEEALKREDDVPEFLRRFQKDRKNEENQSSDVYVMDFRVSVNDDVRFNLIMDPIAGDKITAYGNGAMTLTYSSLSDQLRIYGKYVLDKGTYNFSLQDIILKEFIIKPGSSIAFTGDPYTGTLNLTAAYRVNTSLTELDQSFSNDRELNRTSVPVEALLKVTGVLTSPTIDFDIELPTVTEETAQKVRSIISTEDMMSRQVLYLVALNKFYPPEYMATSNSGGEWASIASSTISSQIQNMIGQLTDKFTIAPSIRSDKGDFSDIEVDLALSSQLFNNRLLINGNIGYRDPSNSSTTFVGDFDLEYLLNRKGTWRLKAYNHFNDQNYYLKSALTTQGIGLVWRKDFGLPRKRVEKREEQPEKKTDEKTPAEQ